MDNVRFNEFVKNLRLQFVSTQVGSGLEIGGMGVFGKCYGDAVACV